MRIKMEVKWRQIIYKGVIYPHEVSEYGEVRRLAGYDCVGRYRKAKIQKPLLDDGYVRYAIGVNRKTIFVAGHALVAFAFLGDPPGVYGTGKKDSILVNHKDCKKTNNHYSNLEWATPKQNSNHAAKHRVLCHGEAVVTAKLNVAKVIEIRKSQLAGESKNSLAKRFGVSSTNISAICAYKTWKYLGLVAT